LDEIVVGSMERIWDGTLEVGIIDDLTDEILFGILDGYWLRLALDNQEGIFVVEKEGTSDGVWRGNGDGIADGLFDRIILGIFDEYWLGLAVGNHEGIIVAAIGLALGSLKGIVV